MDNFLQKSGFLFFDSSTSLKTIALLTVCWLFSKVFTKKKNSKYDGILSVADIPGPRPPIPIKFIGHLPKFLPISNCIKQFLKWDQEFPGLMKIYGANKTFVGLHSPELIQQLFKSTDFGHDVKAPIIYDKMKPFITNGVLVSVGKYWQVQRKILMKTQRFQTMKTYMEMLNRHSANFVRKLDELFKDEESHEINEEINILFLKVIFEMITGSDESSNLDQYHHNFQTWKLASSTRMPVPWLHLDFVWRWHPMYEKQCKAIQDMFDFAKEKIKKHRENRKMQINKEGEQVSVKGGTFRSVLDELMDANVKEDQILDEVNTMIFGGHETGATAIHFFCLMMALNQDAQIKCRQEIDALFDNVENFKNGQLTFEAVSANLKYVERSINETLRLYPSVFIVLREIKTSLLIEHNNKKYLLPADTNVAVSSFGIHHNPKYFPDPEKFDPDRFLPKEVAKRHPCTYIPFSGGPRICLGMKFAMLEMKVVVAYLLRYFEIYSDENPEDVALLPFMTLTPERDYVFQFKRRNVI